MIVCSFVFSNIAQSFITLIAFLTLLSQPLVDVQSQVVMDLVMLQENISHTEGI